MRRRVQEVVKLLDGQQPEALMQFQQIEQELIKSDLKWLLRLMYSQSLTMDKRLCFH